MLAEARESAQMIHVVKGVIAYAIKAKRKALMGGWRQLSQNPSLEMAKAWLSYKYGWKPFVQDIYNLVNFQIHQFMEMDFKARASRRLELPAGFNTSYPNLQFPQHKGTSTLSYKGTRVERCEIGVTVEINNLDAFNLSRLTSLNPASIAWELLPLSFVVDWFWNIGGYLENLEAALASGLVFKRGYVTKLHYFDVDETYTVDLSFTGPSQYSESSYYQRAHRTLASKSRVILTGFPLPVFPKIDVHLGASRIISAASLIRTILLGGVETKIPRGGHRK
jgi:hypothetical protein